MFLTVLGIAGAIALAVWAAAEAEKRRKARIAAMRELAQRLGLSFMQPKDTGHDEQFAHFELFRRGFARAAYNTIEGDVDVRGHRARCRMGDFTYKTRHTSTTTDSKGRTRTRTRTVTHRFSYFILDLPFEGVPDMLIRREGFFDKVAAAFGKNDIDFESSEFSRKFFVQCDDRRFAYDIIHPRTMEFLLATEPTLVDMEHTRICLSDGHSHWDAERFEGSLGWTLEFLEHWPGYVVKDLAGGANRPR